jgi:dipeptidase E
MPVSENHRLLLLSNSRDAEGRFLHHPQRQIKTFLGSGVGSVLFVPFAGVTVPWQAYADRVRATFAGMDYRLTSVHETTHQVTAVRDAEAIVVGGGNTFHLLLRLYETGLLDVIRERVDAGVPYIGWSAGSVIACPTIRTTNDMPIVEPPSLTALGVVPFQINAHYTDYHPAGFQGETRAERIAEFLVANPHLRVVGLPEGTMLRVERRRIALLGDGSARVFEAGKIAREVTPDETLDFLLDS